MTSDARQNAGIYVTPLRTTSFWPIKRLNQLSITGYAHLQCVTLWAFPPFCRSSDVISSSVDTLIVWVSGKRIFAFQCMSNVYVLLVIYYQNLYHHLPLQKICIVSFSQLYNIYKSHVLQTCVKTVLKKYSCNIFLKINLHNYVHNC